MRKTIAIVLILFLSIINMNAQSFKAYIAVHYNSVTCSVIVNIGEEAIVIKDASGNPKKFSTLIAVFNYLGQKGWTIVPIDMQNSNTRAGDMYLFTKTVSSVESIKKDFEKNKVPERQN